MRFLLVLIFTTVLSCCSFAQIINQNDLEQIFKALDDGEYKTAFKKSTDILNEPLNDSSEFRGIIVYANIISAAGLVSLNKMTHEKFLLTASKFVGQKIITPPYPCVDSGRVSFNSFGFRTDDAGLYGTVTSTNKTATSIFSFEKYKFAIFVIPGDYLEKYVSCAGILDSIEVNPNKSTIWISRITIRDTYLKEYKVE